MTKPDAALIQRSRELSALCADIVRTRLGGAASVALLDIPNHDNPGDAAILLGEMALLRDVGVDVTYLADLRSYRAAHLARRAPSGPVLLHGGGNVGDVYTRHQDFREAFLAADPGRWTVQLPQSVYFTDPASADASRTLYAGLPRLTFLARDSLALRRASEQLGIEPVLCPDSAFALTADASLVEGLPRGAEPVVFLLRRDREKTGLSMDSDAGPTEDWVINPRRRARLAVRVASRATPYLPAVVAGASQASPRGNLVLARRLVRTAAEQIVRARVLVTDRLHGVILASILGVPHVALDNTNGKVHAFHRDWLDGLASSRRADNLEEARELASELAA
jgi:exopolysaccharide biosynthesis predicted pyruvyltransferase EpsI